MKFNFFEGARRIALGFGFIWSMAFVGYAVIKGPNVSVKYVIADFGAPAVMGENCGENDAQDYATVNGKWGQSVSVNLCFKAREATDGRILVPYEMFVVDNNRKGPSDKYRVQMNDRYSTEVRKYTSLYEKNFKIPPGDIPIVGEMIWKERLNQWEEFSKFIFGGLAVLWATVAFIGWIVRGFMGIPRGRDSRLES